MNYVYKNGSSMPLWLCCSNINVSLVWTRFRPVYWTLNYHLWLSNPTFMALIPVVLGNFHVWSCFMVNNTMILWIHPKRHTYSCLYTLYLYIYICIWVNYNISLTWNKAIWGWFPLLSMIPVRSQWGRYNLPIYIYIRIPSSKLT